MPRQTGSTLQRRVMVEKDSGTKKSKKKKEKKEKEVEKRSEPTTEGTQAPNPRNRLLSRSARARHRSANGGGNSRPRPTVSGNRPSNITHMNITSDHLLDDATPATLPGGNAMPVRRLLVIHFTSGMSAQSSIDFWNSPEAKGASAHIIIDRDGTVFQCRAFDRTCGHAGVSRWKDPNGRGQDRMQRFLDRDRACQCRRQRFRIRRGAEGVWEASLRGRRHPREAQERRTGLIVGKLSRRAARRLFRRRESVGRTLQAR